SLAQVPGPLQAIEGNEGGNQLPAAHVSERMAGGRSTAPFNSWKRPARLNGAWMSILNVIGSFACERRSLPSERKIIGAMNWARKSYFPEISRTELPAIGSGLL
ncbi:hypothetical protein, partial [Delftia tsuruhatensis]|uniref:hypothetical protein n=1 Tax=Delftia tsuruhatensis TaxID=180282 RepID=UPI00214F910D